MNYLKPEQFKVGMRVTCKIGSVKIEDAKLQSIKYSRPSVERDEWYICQNKKDGVSCHNKLGYRYSWCIGDANYTSLQRANVYDLKAYDKLEKIRSILEQIK